MQKNGYEQITQISHQCQDYFQEHSISQSPEHFTGITNSRQTDQNRDQQMKSVPTPTLPCNSSMKQPKTQSKLCETSNLFWTLKPRSVLLNVQETTSGMTNGPKLNNRTSQPADSSLSLRPYASNWAEAQSKHRRMFNHQPRPPNVLEGDERNDVFARHKSLHNYQPGKEESDYSNKSSKTNKWSGSYWSNQCKYDEWTESDITTPRIRDKRSQNWSVPFPYRLSRL